MKKYVKIILYIWFLIVCVFVVKSEITLNLGREVLLETVPVDPRDLLMGDYVILNYKIAQIPPHYKYNNNETVYVKLYADKKNVAHARIIKKEPPKDSLFIKGKVGYCPTTSVFFRGNKCATFGIESYYVKEKTGLKLERDLRNGALVKVSIDKHGNAKVKGFKEKT